MLIDNFDMRFVIGFLVKDEQVLLLKRIKSPWKNKWNGPGGKIETGEKPTDALIRELQEETEIKLEKNQIHFGGIVTWENGKKEQYIRGMFTFTAYITEKQVSWRNEKETREGLISWKPLDWATNKNNNEIAGNIPFFLPFMLKEKNPLRYHCILKDNLLQSVIKLTFPSSFDLIEL